MLGPHGRTLFRAFLVSFIGAHQLSVSSRRHLTIDKHNEVKETYKGSPKESGSICIETTVESYVVLDVYAIVQKWNSYRFQGRRQ